MRVTVMREGVMLDRLVWEVIGTDAGGVFEETLALNPGLAAMLAANGQMLPLGTTITLPEPSARLKVIKTVKLWD